MAEKRLPCLERNLSMKPEVYANVRQQIHDYQTKGYAYKLTEEESNSSDPRKVWYLPLLVVQNPNKLGKKSSCVGRSCQGKWCSLNSDFVNEKWGSRET